MPRSTGTCYFVVGFLIALQGCPAERSYGKLMVSARLGGGVEPDEVVWSPAEEVGAPA